MHKELQTYQRQGFGAGMPIDPPLGLLIVDFVNGFANPAIFGGGNIAAAIENTVPLLRAARRLRWPIAHTRIVFADEGADRNVFTLKVPGLLALIETSPNSAIVSSLAPIAGELVVRKTLPSAFFGTTLAAWLTEKSVRTLLVAGCVTSGCVRASVVDAMSHGFRPVVVSDCVGDRALHPHEASLFDMEQKYAAVMPRDEVLAVVRKASAPR
jgi:maleamate amidohydrolase